MGTKKGYWDKIYKHEDNIHRELIHLHVQGYLTDAEFDRAKYALSEFESKVFKMLDLNYYDRYPSPKTKEKKQLVYA